MHKMCTDASHPTHVFSMWFVDYDVKKYFVSQENFREMANLYTICKLQAIRAEKPFRLN